ncbi:SH3 domain-containing protein [Hoeflea prorocentri]|uniref:SH3 domain-containing protein n=1 Tax=Hoeflea prorocentri TaxID=1922333 RepID=A0A9X3UIP5_9HYPH|nr:SH3 domain-containing protein [Hoeflea prorocentri]MCY6381535.1 SH3 domain-containing protein [Hoeflea prorocentri]MDA5399335.1 SH3 domain-containing protein [Hoeflea prorocentri]
MFKSRTLLAVIAVAGSLAAPSAHASGFAAWEVANVDWNDVLNVRAWPSSKSAIRAGYPNGTPLQMTGRCMNGVDLKDISTLPVPDQTQMVRYTWCEVWHDPTGTEEFQAGWVYGRYIRPQE